MTLAMVKVLPEPVTPSSTWCCLAVADAADELLDGLLLVAARAVVDHQTKAHRLQYRDLRWASRTSRSYSALNSQPMRATAASTYIHTSSAMAAPMLP